MSLGELKRQVGGAIIEWPTRRTNSIRWPAWTGKSLLTFTWARYALNYDAANDNVDHLGRLD